MADPVYTLEYVGSTEQTLAAWGFASPTLTTRSQGATEFSVRVPGQSMTAAPPIPFEAIVKVKVDGSTIFTGRQVTSRRTSQVHSFDTLVFQDAWYDLEHIVFQHAWKLWDPLANAFITKQFSRINLFQRYPDGAFLHNGPQIRQIVEWARTCGANLQAGTIDLDDEMPFYPVKAIMCSEAIELCLKPTPNAVTWIDGTTSPPTFHCRKEPDLAAVTLPFRSTSGGIANKATNISPRPDLKPSQVVVDYQETLTVTDSTSGTTVACSTERESYPPASDGQALRALVLPVDLQSSVSQISQKLVSATLPTTMAAWKTWLKLKKPELNADKLQSSLSNPSSVTVTDEAGASIDTGVYARELTDGSGADWMKDTHGDTILIKTAIVTAKISWTEYTAASGGVGIKKHVDTTVSVRIRVTNSAAGEITYSNTLSQEVQVKPVGLPKAIWDSLTRLQYEGEHEVVEPFVSQIIGPWNVLNISGGMTEWASMRACIQSVRHEFFFGRTTVSIGPAKHIAPGDLAEAMTIFRFRFVPDNPARRVSGEFGGSSGSASEAGKTIAKENTTHGVEAPAVHGAVHPSTGAGSAYSGDPVIVVAQHHAENREIRLHCSDPTTGATIGGGTGEGSVIMRLTDCIGSDGEFKDLYIQEVDICVLDGEDLVPMKTLILCCDPFEP